MMLTMANHVHYFNPQAVEGICADGILFGVGTNEWGSI